jgi:hypothetical protein
VVSSHTRLVVYEDPRAVPKAARWSIVLERIKERGEEPVGTTIALNKPSSIPLLFTVRSTTQMHIWEPPTIDELGWDLAVVQYSMEEGFSRRA